MSIPKTIFLTWLNFYTTTAQNQPNGIITAGTSADGIATLSMQRRREQSFGGTARHSVTGERRYLFNLANNFGMRHHNQRQKTKYDRPIWYSWMFYYYLARARCKLDEH